MRIATDLPGNDLISAGLEDLRAGRDTEPAMLVAMARRRLSALGIDVPQTPTTRPSHRLYELLSDSGPAAHSRYNALVNRLVSFLRAAERDAAAR